MKNSLFVLFFLHSVSYGADEGPETPQSGPMMMTKEAFATAASENPFLREYGLHKAIYPNPKVYGVHPFKGTLDANGLHSLESKALESIATNSFDKCDDLFTAGQKIEPLTDDTLVVGELRIPSKDTTDNAVDYEPDFSASILSTQQMNQLSERRFKTIVLENLPYALYFDPTLYTNVERLLSPGGEVRILGGLGYAIRAAVVMTQNTPWWHKRFTNALSKHFAEEEKRFAQELPVQVTYDLVLQDDPI